MVIGIDIDDTITDTFDYLIPYVSEYFSVDINYLKENNISYSSLPEEYKEKQQDFGKATYAKVLFDVPIKNGARKIINRLKDDGNKIVIITARDETIYDEPYKLTEMQLSKLGIKYDKLICSFDKRKACLDENIDVFIDDSIKNLEEVNDVVKEAILFNSKVNNNISTSFTRVNTWEEIYELLNK